MLIISSSRVTIGLGKQEKGRLSSWQQFERHILDKVDHDKSFYRDLQGDPQTTIEQELNRWMIQRGLELLRTGTYSGRNANTAKN